MNRFKFRAWLADQSRYLTFDFSNMIDYIAVMDFEDVVEQFTGLKDKNGVEIYEGDILENVGDQFSDLKGETIFMVIYQGSGFVMKYKTGTFFMSSLTHLYKKIGNIHENPELLEVRK